MPRPAYRRAGVELNPYGAYPGISGNLVAAGDRVFYFADDGVHGVEPSMSDGTAAGTAMITDLTPGLGGATISSPVAAGGVLFFNNAILPLRPLGDPRSIVWRTDGTAAGTFPLGPTRSFSSGFAAVRGKVYFTASTPDGGGIYASDGTVAGTRLFTSGSGSGIPPISTIAPNDVYYGFNGTIYRYDGVTSAVVRADTPVIGLKAMPGYLLLQLTNDRNLQILDMATG